MADDIVLAKSANNKPRVVLAHPNLVKIGGTVKDGTDTLAERTIEIFKSGTSDLIRSTTSDPVTGEFLEVFPENVNTKMRIVAYAKKGESDEQSKAFDFVTPIQHSIQI